MNIPGEILIVLWLSCPVLAFAVWEALRYAERAVSNAAAEYVTTEMQALGRQTCNQCAGRGKVGKYRPMRPWENESENTPMRLVWRDCPGCKGRGYVEWLCEPATPERKSMFEMTAREWSTSIEERAQQLITLTKATSDNKTTCATHH